MCESHISHSISALGVSAATESTTIRSTAHDLTRVSTISNACSQLSGWETYKSFTFTHILVAYEGSSACSASIKAAVHHDF